MISLLKPPIGTIFQFNPIKPTFCGQNKIIRSDLTIHLPIRIVEYRTGTPNYLENRNHAETIAPSNL